MAPIITMPRLMAIGGGALAELPGTLQRLGMTKPLIVTDPFLLRSGHLEKVTANPRQGRHPVAGIFRHRRGPDDGGRRNRR